MATATYIGVLSVSLKQLVLAAALLVCVGEGLGVKSTVTTTVAVIVTDSVVVVIYSVVVSVTVISSSRPESVPLAVPLVTLML